MAATTRNLIALETDDAFLRWEEASQEADAANEAATAGEKLANDENRDFTAGLKVKVDEVVNAHVLAAQARSQYNEFSVPTSVGPGRPGARDRRWFRRGTG